jgi:hypothetical protein
MYFCVGAFPQVSHKAQNALRRQCGRQRRETDPHGKEFLGNSLGSDNGQVGLFTGWSPVLSSATFTPLAVSFMQTNHWFCSFT